MNRKTKIVATLGPSTESKKAIRELVNAGLNIARLNFSHGTYDQCKDIVKNIREVEEESGKTITIMQDLQGPKIRLDRLEKPIPVKKGQSLTLSTKKGEKDTVHVPYKDLPKMVKKGQALLIEDGMIRSEILWVKGNHIHIKFLNAGTLKSAKGINVPDSQMPISKTLTPKDKEDLAFGVKTLKVDAMAVSFVESAKDIERVRAEIAKHSKKPIMIVAKIERKAALENLESIIEAADALMVARGDLGIETEAERVPIEQKRILALARSHGKPVIIATQILQSMVENPLPTRAEVSDAAQAVFEHADAFMLSNETAVGKYPNKAVKTLARVAQTTEAAIFQNTELFPLALGTTKDPIEDQSIALNACKVADEINAAGIVIVTKAGFTARTVLKHRPKTPVVIVTDAQYKARQFNFFWGANQTLVYKGPMRSEEILKFLKKEKIFKAGQDIVFTKLSDSKRSLVVMSV